MFDGKTFFPVTGIPMRKMACMSKLFALADPVPLTVAIVKAKSLMREAGCLPRRANDSDTGHLHAVRGPRVQSRRPLPARRRAPRIRDDQFKLSHVPRRRRTPLGAEPAMETHILVFHHHPLRLR